MDVVGQLVLTGLGSGSAVAIIMRAWFASRVQIRKVEAHEDQDHRTALLEVLRTLQQEKREERAVIREEREATGRHQTNFLDCQEELQKVRGLLASREATLAVLQQRVGELEREREEAEWKVRALEGQVMALAKQLGIHLKPIDLPPKSLPPIPIVDPEKP
jgi:chromosome segregation ATPase